MHDHRIIGQRNRVNSGIEIIENKYYVPYAADERLSEPPSAIFNILSTMFDGTSLSLPHAFSKVGIIGGSILLCAFALLTKFSLQILIILCFKTGVNSYSSLVHSVLGKYSKFGFCIVVTILLVMILIAFMVLLKQILRDVIIETVLICSGSYLRYHINALNTILLIILLACIYPFAIKSQLYPLKYLCYIEFTCVCILQLCLLLYCARSFVYALDYSTPPTYDISIRTTPPPLVILLPYHFPDVLIILFPDSIVSIAQAIPTMILLYLAHINIFDIMNEIRAPSILTLTKINNYSISIVTVIYLVVGISGYIIIQMCMQSQPIDSSVQMDITNTNTTALLGVHSLGMGCGTGNILLFFPPNTNIIIYIGRIAMSIALLCSLPLLIIPIRNTIMGLAIPCEDSNSLEVDNNNNNNNTDLEILIQMEADCLVDVKKYSSSSSSTTSRINPLLYPVYNSLDYRMTSITHASTMLLNPQVFIQDEQEPLVSHNNHILTIALLVFCVCMSSFISEVSIIWSILVSTIGILVAYILPAVLYIRFCYIYDIPRHRTLMLCWILLIFSCIISITCVVMNINSLFK